MASDSQGFEAFFYCARPPSSRDVNLITLLFRYASNVGIPNSKVARMLLLTAILRVWLAPEPKPNDLLAEARQRIGHVGLTVIALVFILVTFWQR
jgi:hypothetical protein